MSLLSVTRLSATATELISTARSEGAVNVDLDLSFVVQIALFVVLLLVLKPLLFDPMMRLFEEREQRIDKTIEGARKMDEASAKAQAKYEAAVGKGREAGASEANTIRTQGAKQEAELLAKARAASAATLEQGRTAIRAEANQARAALKQQAAVLGRDIASRVLGRGVSP